jgi:hypothetical protein
MKKKELIIIGLISVGLWFISGIIQFLYRYNPTGISACNLTGYPISDCYSSFERVNWLTTVAFNIAVWYGLTLVIWKLVRLLFKR